MPIAVVILCVAAGILLFLAALWLFLISPAPRKGRVKPFERPYAHRGLWGGDVPENSLAAFRRAAEAGFAVELDVQLSSDGEVFVFHDYSLARMCGRTENLSDLTAAELREIPLAGGTERIPTFREVLDAVDGRVPILIELKGESGDTAVCPATLKVLESYRGAWCVESFNPLLLSWFRRHCPDAVRGLLRTDLIKEKKKGSRLVNRLLSSMWLNFLARPTFLAWDGKYDDARVRRVLRMGAASFVFTVKNEADYRRYLAAGTSPIFDGFLPGK